MVMHPQEMMLLRARSEDRTFAEVMADPEVEQYLVVLAEDGWSLQSATTEPTPSDDAWDLCLQLARTGEARPLPLAGATSAPLPSQFSVSFPSRN